MRWELLGERVMRNMDERAGPTLMALALFTMGVVFGALAVGSLGVSDRQELLTAVADLFSSIRQSGPPASPAAILAGAVARYLRLVALFWLLGISVVGSLGVLAMVLMRGLAAGFTAGLLGAEMGWRGMVYSAAALLPHNLLVVPAVVLAAGGAVHFAIGVAGGRMRRDRGHFYRALARYNLWMLALLLLFAAASLVEAYVTPLLIRWAARL